MAHCRFLIWFCVHYNGRSPIPTSLISSDMPGALGAHTSFPSILRGVLQSGGSVLAQYRSRIRLCVHYNGRSPLTALDLDPRFWGRTTCNLCGNHVAAVKRSNAGSNSAQDFDTLIYRFSLSWGPLYGLPTVSISDPPSPHAQTAMHACAHIAYAYSFFCYPSVSLVQYWNVRIIIRRLGRV